LQKVALATVGCKVNQYETQLMRERLEKLGYRVVPFSSHAEFYIVNTCTVTRSADKKSIDLIKRALKKNGSTQILVTGCLVEAEWEKIKKEFPQIRIVRNKDKLRIERFLSPSNFLEEDLFIHSFSGHDRAFVKIEDGCNRFCSYCRIPYVRGSTIRSKKIEDVIQEVSYLIKAGYREIVLTGVNLALYGKDFIPPLSLVDLLEKLLNSLSRDHKEFRIRLSSLEPHLIPDKLVDLLASLPFVCPHLHLAFQSGDDKILEKMGRGYKISQVIALVDNFKSKIPQLGLTGDVMVGFPGEDDDSFYRTCDFIKRIGFHRLHIFCFSPRPGTSAFKMKPVVRESVKRKRSNILKNLSKDLSWKFIEKFVGENLPVLIERKRDAKTGYLTGYTHNYIKVLIPFSGDDTLLSSITGKIIPVKITQANPGYALGELSYFLKLGHFFHNIPLKGSWVSLRKPLFGEQIS